MCRLLAVKSSDRFDIPRHLQRFVEVARRSREWQGDGWGCAWREGKEWRLYKNVRPIWEDDLGQFGRTSLLLAHARSAFRNEGIAVENNMPFVAGPRVFIFNGELHGVRVNVPGRIGAEKIFNFILRLGRHHNGDALAKAAGIITRRSGYVKAMNIILAEGTTLRLHTAFSEAEDYFTLHRKNDSGCLLLCSEPYPGEPGWTPLPNHYLEVFP